MKKKENDDLMKKKRKRTKDKTDIVYNANKGKLIDCFCQI